MKRFNCRNSILVSKNEEGEKLFDEGKVRLVPAWKFALGIGDGIK